MRRQHLQVAWFIKGNHESDASILCNLLPIPGFKRGLP